GFGFWRALELSIGFESGCAHCFNRLLVRICTFVFFRRRVFIRPLFRLAVNRNRRYEHVAIDVPFEHLCCVTHPRGKRCRVIDDHIPLPIFQRFKITVTVADKLLDLRRQLARMRLTPVKCGHLMSATQRILHLKRASESGAAEYEYAHRCRCLLCKQKSWCCSRRKRSCSGYFY